MTYKVRSEADIARVNLCISMTSLPRLNGFPDGQHKYHHRTVDCVSKKMCLRVFKFPFSFKRNLHSNAVAVNGSNINVCLIGKLFYVYVKNFNTYDIQTCICVMMVTLSLSFQKNQLA